ncbi:ABC transporter substrate-binding protein [Peptoniphilus raoultii]|uniref:ABC transporter substrate-binding protein n=1 Tax=Peptoniphilus raoultii TaxID=1776387 RepID=UPI0008DA9817|nr:ABC transporter substrate-binding protein [Peptoniphilus raoultii]
MKKKLLFLMMALLFLTACGTSNNTGNASGSGGEDSDEIILRGIGPKTGAVAIYGLSAENGIKMAIDEINEAGGINGKKINYESGDDKGDSTEAMNLYSRYVEEGAHAIIGAVTSKPTLAIAENSQEDNIPIVTPTGTMLSITEGKPNVFRVCFTDPSQGVTLANFAANNLSVKTAAVLRNTSSDYSNGVSDAFIEEAKAKGIEILADEGYGATDKDFKVQLTNIKSQNPDVLLVADYYENDVVIAKQAKDLGINSKILGPDGWDGVLSVAAEGDEGIFENCYFTNHYYVDDEKEVVKNFVDNYRKLYNEDPSSFSALGYDTVYVYKKALEESKSLSHEDIIEALNNVTIDGVTGSLKFDENNNPIKSTAILTIKDGKYVLDSFVE